MSDPFIFDAVTLRHFGAVDRLDLLENRCASSTPPHWAEEVYDEIVANRGLPQCNQVLAATFLGSPLEPGGETGLREIYMIQVGMNEGRRPPTAHLGEAASLYHAEKLGGILVTDDNGAHDFASRRLGPGRVLDTVDVLRQAVAMGELNASGAQQVADAIRNQDRHLRRDHPATFPLGYFG